MSPSGIYDHADRIGIRTRCSICGALGVNRSTCPKTTPEEHHAHRKAMNSYRKKYDLGARDSIARTGVSEPRYEREWQSINNGEDLTLNFSQFTEGASKPNIISPAAVGGTIPPEWLHDLTLRIRVKIEVVFE